MWLNVYLANKGKISTGKEMNNNEGSPQGGKAKMTYWQSDILMIDIKKEVNLIVGVLFEFF